MKMQQVGSFEAKTRFSELIRDVMQGKTYEILRRGKPVAQLTSIAGRDNSNAAKGALEYFRTLRHGSGLSIGEIRQWIDEGRR